jgi:hypothetical protein
MKQNCIRKTWHLERSIHMKRILAYLCGILLLALPATALAETAQPTPTPAPVSATASPEQPKPTLSPEEKALRASLTAAKRQVTLLEKQIGLQAKANSALSKQISRALKQVKAGTKTISAEAEARIRELGTTIKTLRDAEKSTNGQAKQYLSDARASVAKKDFTAANTAVNQAITVLQGRLKTQQDINTALKEQASLLK